MSRCSFVRRWFQLDGHRDFAERGQGLELELAARRVVALLEVFAAASRLPFLRPVEPAAHDGLAMNEDAGRARTSTATGLRPTILIRVMSADGPSFSDTNQSLPDSSSVVIVGGGVIGCSIAYHLAKRGCSDVVLLERHRLTAGTTWHAAGLVVTSGFTTNTGMEIAKYTRDLYATLEQETGFATGFDPVGLLQVAVDQEILEDLRRKMTFGRSMGIDTQELSPSEVGDLWPLARTDDVLAGFLTAG